MPNRKEKPFSAEALSDLFPPKLIRASAGTGKTFDLSSRFISLLAAGESPKRILATTFTRKAAAEIMDRVFSRLANAADDPNEAAATAGYIGQPSFSSQSACQALRRLIQAQHCLNICTLDSFFFCIASSFGFELGFPVEWRIAEEKADFDLKQEAIRTLCSAKNRGDLTALVHLLNKGETRRAIHKQIKNSVEDLYRLFRVTDSRAWDWLTPPSRLKDQEVQVLAAELPALQGLRMVNKEREPDKSWCRALQNAAEAIRLGQWQDFMKNGIAPKVLSGETFYKKPVPEEAARVFRPLIRHACAVLLGNLHSQGVATYKLLEAFAAELEQARRHTPVYNFDDIKLSLSRASVWGRMEELYYRLDSRIAHLLLDEFQDTSGPDWQVLKPIAAEILSKASGQNSFFCVGDVKQAIYGWRGSVAEIFDSLENEYPLLKGRSEHKELSRRSSPAVIDAVNQVFGSIAQNAALKNFRDAARHWAGRFNPHTTINTQTPSYVRFEVISCSEQETRQEAVVRTVVGIIKRIVRGRPDLSIGVLVRRNTTVGEYIFALSSKDAAIPASEEGGNPLTDSPAVSLILSLLRLAEHPADTVSRFHAASSVLGEILGFTSHDDIAAAVRLGSEIRRAAVFKGLGPTIQRWVKQIESLPQAAAISRRDFRRLHQLVAFAHAYDRRPAVRISDFIERVRFKHVDDPSSSNVRVMTIHQAKGLEFDVVIMPDLDRELIGKPYPSFIAFYPSPVEAPSKICRYPSKTVRSLSAEIEEIYNQDCDRQIKEALNLLYVAMTRAKTALYMISGDPLAAAPGEGAPTFGRILGTTFLSGSGESSTVFENGDSSRLTAAAAPAGKPPSSVDAGRSPRSRALNLKTAPQTRLRGLLRKTPSGLEGGSEVDLNQVLQLGSKTASIRGSLWHKFFAAIEWLDRRYPAEGDLSACIMPGDCGRNEAKRLIEEFLCMLKTDKIAAILDSSYYSAWAADELQAQRELPFAVRINDSILTGVIDRLVIGRQKGEISAAEIIDYKTDRISSDRPDELSQKVRFYKPQMEAYRIAAAKLTSLPPEVIAVKLVFTAAGLIQEI